MLHYINERKKCLVGRNNQVNTVPIVLDYDTIGEESFQIITDQNQIMDIEGGGYYLAAGLKYGQPSNFLIFLSKSFTIADKTITFSIDTYTVPYLNQIKQKSTQVYLELGRYDGSTKTVILRDNAYANPRLYIEGQAPSLIESDFYTKAEIDAMLSGFVTEEALSGYASKDYIDEATSAFITDENLQASISGKQDKITSSSKLAYSLLSGTPTIPTVNNSTITLSQGGTTKGSFTLNQVSGTTIDFDAGGGGGSSPSSLYTPGLYEEIQLNGTVSSIYRSQANANWNTSVQILDSNKTFNAGLHTIGVDIIHTATKDYTFSAKDSLVFTGRIISNRTLNLNESFETHLVTLYLNDEPIRQGIYYAHPCNDTSPANWSLNMPLNPIEDGKATQIHTGDTLRLHYEIIFNILNTSSLYTWATSSINRKLTLGANPCNLTYWTNEVNGFNERLNYVIPNLGVYKLSFNGTSYSGDYQYVETSENNFYENDPSYSIGDSLTLYMNENSTFVFKTDSNFSTYSVSFYNNNVQYINAPVNFQANKAYIISYYGGVVLWAELQDYSNN